MRDLQDGLGIQAVDIYGRSEIFDPGVACERNVAHNGLHGWENRFLFEVVDPHILKQLAEGEAGEPVITTLTGITRCPTRCRRLSSRSHSCSRLCCLPRPASAFWA